MKVLFVFHDSPYGTERTYNGLRWAKQLAEREDTEARIYLFGDAVIAAAAEQRTPTGSHNIGKMVDQFASLGGEVGSCKTCLNARGIMSERLRDSTRLASVADLGEWTVWADKVINV
ncbi:DsrE family protein [Actinomadura sp. KC216]|uniref:DsrE/DsrF/TusD sulfur relay family protein n=1 Tax=Actinomadura sp. KC216 TaxID=2530370 RepID=UPI001A9E60A2|nr:DsrE family protein [Actinomadura sp. KC216]